jgi:hypothetical protein
MAEKPTFEQGDWLEHTCRQIVATLNKAGAHNCVVLIGIGSAEDGSAEFCAQAGGEIHEHAQALSVAAASYLLKYAGNMTHEVRQ